MQAISPRVTMFKKILIANRGEIACRVMTTARRMGIRTVAVYSDADASSRHVAMADEAVRIGPAAASESYLRSDRIVAAVHATEADAVHPGYGFLSENEAFAQALADAKVTFIGPPPSAIRAMGSKSEAKKLMERAKVPLVPGYHGDKQQADLLLKEANRIGYPVLIKASAGGGGKGMRVVDAARRVHRCSRFLPARSQGVVQRRPRADREIRATPATHRDTDIRRPPRQRGQLVRARLFGAAAASENH